MRISPDEVLKVARLAELAVAEADLPTLVRQFNDIVGYVAQLDALPPEGDITPFVPGPAAVRWRPDVVGAEPLVLPPAALAPAFRDGFFVVPRLASMEPE